MWVFFSSTVHIYMFLKPPCQENLFAVIRNWKKLHCKLLGFGPLAPWPLDSGSRGPNKPGGQRGQARGPKGPKGPSQGAKGAKRGGQSLTSEGAKGAKRGGQRGQRGPKPNSILQNFWAKCWFWGQFFGPFWGNWWHFLVICSCPWYPLGVWCFREVQTWIFPGIPES